MVASVRPGTGRAVAAGSADLAGPGDGAGGEGAGTGGGGSGDGPGEGEVPPRLRRGRIRTSDLPADLRDVQFGVTVAVRYEVGVDGRVADCTVTSSSGYAELDRLTCRLIEERFRYTPAQTREGEEVAAVIEEEHRWSNEGIDTSEPRPQTL